MSVIKEQQFFVRFISTLWYKNYTDSKSVYDVRTFKAVLPDLTISNKLPSPSLGSVQTFFLDDTSRPAPAARLPRFPVLCTDYM